MFVLARQRQFVILEKKLQARKQTHETNSFAGTLSDQLNCFNVSFTKLAQQQVIQNRKPTLHCFLRLLEVLVSHCHQLLNCSLQYSLTTETPLPRHCLMDDPEQLWSPLFALHRPGLCSLHQVTSI